MDLKNYVKDVKDFTIEGILFRDVTPLLQDKDAYKYAVDEIAEYARSKGAEVVVGPESRGFIVGCPVAYALNAGFVPVRKPNKLPRKTISYKYDLEYGTATLEMQKGAIKPNDRVLIIDDLLATGGTVGAVIDLVKKCKAIPVAAAFVINLSFLPGEKILTKKHRIPVFSLLEYDHE